MRTDEYRVELRHYAGPMDLLLHLVKKEEVDIHDIPIARILEQYLDHLTIIEELDLDDAGEFTVMAATLMAIKSKMLLPIEEVDLEEEIDPRYELVQQLLEYKRLKDSGSVLEQRAEVFSQRVGRPASARPGPVAGEDRSLSEIGLAELLETFAKLLESVGQNAGKRERHVAVDDRPVRVYMDRLNERLSKDGVVRFQDLLQTGSRPELIGYFLALLVLLKQERLGIAEEPGSGELIVQFRGDAGALDDSDHDPAEDDFR